MDSILPSWLIILPFISLPPVAIVVRLQHRSKRLLLSLPSISDMLQHPLCIVLIFADLIDCLFILEDVNDDFVFILVVLVDKVTLTKVLTC